MSLLSRLQFQKIDDSDDISAQHQKEEQINLNEQVDEKQLEDYWTKVVRDLEKDPNWFNFSKD